MKTIKRYFDAKSLKSQNLLSLVNATFGIIITIMVPVFYSLSDAGVFYSAIAFFQIVQGLISCKSGEIYFRALKSKNGVSSAKIFLIVTAVTYCILSIIFFNTDIVSDFKLLDINLIVFAMYLPLFRLYMGVLYYRVAAGEITHSVKVVLLGQISLIVLMLIYLASGVHASLGVVLIVYAFSIIRFCKDLSFIQCFSQILSCINTEKDLILGGVFKIFQSNKESFYLSLIVSSELVAIVRILKIPYSIVAVYMDSFLARLLSVTSPREAVMDMKAIVGNNWRELVIFVSLSYMVVYFYLSRDSQLNDNQDVLLVGVLSLMVVCFFHVIGDWWYRYYTLCISPRWTIYISAASFSVMASGFVLAYYYTPNMYFYFFSMSAALRYFLFNWRLRYETIANC